MSVVPPSGRIIVFAETTVQEDEQGDRQESGAVVFSGRATRHSYGVDLKESVEIWRWAATDSTGNPADLLAEMRSRLAPSSRIPWLSLTARADAFEAVSDLNLPARTKAALRRHIDATPYCTVPKAIITWVRPEHDPGFARGRVARTESVTQDVNLTRLREAVASGRDPIPFASDGVRRAVLGYLESDLTEIKEVERQRLIDHVRRAPYLT